MRYAFALMTDRKTARPAEAMEAARAAQRTLNEALETAKQLKTKSRDAKRRVKAAKKAAKKASKVARAARKTADEARRQYKKAVARVAKARAKAANKGKKEEKIVTPKRTSPSRNHPAARRGDRAGARARRQVWDVGEDAADNGSAESATAS
jgi:translation initiation factor 2B subunit (eIF-2B alpha/beta/delta family)